LTVGDLETLLVEAGLSKQAIVPWLQGAHNLSSNQLNTLITMVSALKAEDISEVNQNLEKKIEFFHAPTPGKWKDLVSGE